jgi:virulence-associated protein VapD
MKNIKLDFKEYLINFKDDKFLKFTTKNGFISGPVLLFNKTREIKDYKDFLSLYNDYEFKKNYHNINLLDNYSDGNGGGSVYVNKNRFNNSNEMVEHHNLITQIIDVINKEIAGNFSNCQILE